MATESENDIDDAADEEWEEPEEPVVDLFSETVLPSVRAAVQHAATAHGFDLIALLRELGVDFYGSIKVVNFVRSAVSRGLEPAQVLAELRGESRPWDGEAYLAPALIGDPLLYGLEELLEQEVDAEDDEVSSLREQVTALQEQLATMRGTVRRLVEEEGAVAALVSKPQDNDTYYFDSYAHAEIHRTMLADRVRTEAYRDAIEKNSALLSGKVVLDLGCGTGILSLFCARAGAAHVVGMDRSAIIDVAHGVVEANGLRDRITLVRGKAEDASLPDGVERVDVIVSEWMGYALLYESMLDSVLVARDRWLRKGGRLLPNRSTICVEAYADAAALDRRQEFWRDMYGFDFSCVPRAFREAVPEPEVEILDPTSVCSDRVTVLDIDIATVKKEDLDFHADFALRIRDGDEAKVTGIVLSFDVFFAGPEQDWCEVSFSTSPGAAPTHWKQTLLTLEAPIAVGGGSTLFGNVAYARNAKNPREIDMVLELRRPDGESIQRKYTMH